MTGLFIIEKKEAVQEVQSVKNPSVTYEACNVVFSCCGMPCNPVFFAYQFLSRNELLFADNC